AQSPTLAMGKQAKEMIVQGLDVVNLSQGEPDFSTPDNISLKAVAAISHHETDSYTTTSGLTELKQAVVSRVQLDYQTTINPDQVVVTTGAKLALFTLMQTLVDPGDLVVTPAPFWVSYSEQVKLAGGTLAVVQPTNLECKLTIKSLETLDQKPKLVILNTPNNPSGSVYTKDELAALIKWTEGNGVYLILDEIYGKLVYGDTKFHSGLELMPIAGSRVIIINGVSKSYAMTGWRIGWAIADEEITAAMNKLLGHLTSNPTVAAQYAAIEALTGPQTSVELMRQAFERRLNLIYDGITKINNLSVPFKPQGAFYLFFKVDPEFMQGHNYEDTNQVSMALLNEEMLAIPAGEGFGMPGYLRLSYAKSAADLTEALKRLEHFFND
ncbi:pyridoxal phosphate-dependent aminotransferase, partial [Fructobacillus ficulneus]